MADNLSEILKNITSGMDKKTINRAIPEFKKIISTPEGQRLVSEIRKADRDSLAKLISELKTGKNPDILKNLSKLLNKEE